MVKDEYRRRRPASGPSALLPAWHLHLTWSSPQPPAPSMHTGPGRVNSQDAFFCAGCQKEGRTDRPHASIASSAWRCWRHKQHGSVKPCADERRQAGWC